MKQNLLWLLLLLPCEALGNPIGAELSLPFVENRGQLTPSIRAYASTPSGMLAVTNEGSLRIYPTGGKEVIEQTFPGARITVTGVGRRTQVNLFRGSDPADWHRALPTYQRLSLGELYQGITLELEAHPGNVEQLFQVAPGADPNQIRVQIEGGLRIAKNGSLAVDTGSATIRFTEPIAYQQTDRSSHAVEVAYRLIDGGYTFAIGTYDPAWPLTIDPLVATYLGGSEQEDCFGLTTHYLAKDAELYVYVVGATPSLAATFPPHTSGAQPDSGGDKDAFVARLDHDLTVLTMTFLGGSGEDNAFDVAVHPESNAVYVTGRTASTDFPTAPAAGRGRGSAEDAFVVRLSADLSTLEQSRYLGGAGDDAGLAIAVDNRTMGPTADSVYVTGTTESSDFPDTAGSPQTQLGSNTGDGFLARLTEDLDTMRSTYLGGDGRDEGSAIAIDAIADTIYVAGRTSYNPREGIDVGDFPWTDGGARGFGGQMDAFVVRFSDDLSQAMQATYLGGGLPEFGTAVVAHPFNGDVYVTGSTGEDWDQFPTGGAHTTTAGGTDAFIARLSHDLTTLKSASYFGGTSTERAYDLLIQPLVAKVVYMVGTTGSSNLPDTAGGLFETSSGGDDTFLVRWSTDLSNVLSATYYGGQGMDSSTGHLLGIGNDPATAHLYLFAGGTTGSDNLPGVTSTVAQSTRSMGDAFVARFDATLAGQPVQDADQDGVLDVEDNCPNDANTDQLDTDGDGDGDACDEDDDDDLLPDTADNCPTMSNPEQIDADGDQVGTLCDNCPQVANTNQEDVNQDGIGDICANGRYGPLVNIVQTPEDPVLGDRITYAVAAQDPNNIAAIKLFVDGQPIKSCYGPGCTYATRPAAYEPSFAVLAVDNLGYYRTLGEVPEIWISEAETVNTLDGDGDGVPEIADNCQGTENPDQGDLDGDGVGDACDVCCPGCGENILDAQYCCMAGIAGQCIEQLATPHGRYYWEDAYDLMTSNGCACFDSDGYDTYNSGTVFLEQSTPERCQANLITGQMTCIPAKSDCEEFADYCVDHNTVHEYYCGPHGVAERDVECPSADPVCERGRCRCPDSDGGRRYFRRGTLEVDGVEYTDECASPAPGHPLQLKEVYCERTTNGTLRAAFAWIDCEFRCEEGEGRCRCLDNDGGITPETPGLMGTTLDYCLDARRLVEVYPHIAQMGAVCEVRTTTITCPGLCDRARCLEPTCDDRVQNQGEEDVDCGGPCVPCDLCSVPEDELPARFHWGDWLGRSWITPIQDQGLCGSCWAFGVVAAVESKILTQHTDGWIPPEFFTPPDPRVWNPPDLSEQNLVSECGNSDGDCTGGSHDDALDEIRTTGIVDELCYTYTSSSCLAPVTHDCICESNAHCTNPVECRTTCEDTGLAELADRSWFIDGDSNIEGDNGVADVKHALVCSGPLVTCSDDWGHCLTIVGWDNDSETCFNDDGRLVEGGCWILKNSHGVFTGWDRNSDCCDDRYYVVDGFVYIPFAGHDYSRSMRLGADFITGVRPPAGWTWP